MYQDYTTERWFKQPQKTFGEANITVNHNRIKVYGYQVYLQDKQAFELELYNPGTTVKLAKISLNGKRISESGIVLKPGQRVHIERFLDSPRKFLFETYTVDNSPETQAATANNGLVQVDFYDERRTSTDYDYFTLTKSGGSDAGCFNINNYQQRFSRNAFNTSSVNLNLRQATFTSNTRDFGSPVLKSLKKETGRIEKGEASNQRFTNHDGDFSPVATNSVIYKILPYSEKPLEVKDLAVYCTQCGTKNKGNSYHFCPKCGKEF